MAGVLTTDALADCVGRGGCETAGESPGKLHVQSVVAGRESRKKEIRVRRTPEGVKLGPSLVPEANYRRGVEVIVDNRVDAVIPNVSYIESEAPGQRLLGRRVPRFHVRVLETLIHYKVVGTYSRVGNDPVRWDRRLNEGGETSLKSCNLSAGKHCRAIARNGRIEGVIGAHREIVSVAVIGGRGIADSESGAEDGRFLQTVGHPQPWREVFVMRRDPLVVRIAAVAADDKRIVDGIVI